MIILYIALPVALLLATVAVIAFIWSARSGQLDDLDTPPVRMLFDDEPLPDQTRNDSTGDRTDGSQPPSGRQ